MIDMVFLPVMCMQCDDAPCVAVGAGAVEKRPDGIVRINYKKITGNDKLQEYCPYGAIYFNSEANVPQKCDFCAHLLDEGEKEPRCVSVCPTGALTFREVDESEYATLLENGWEVYGQARSTSVLYKNLDRFEKYFLGGSLVRSGDCAGNETVKLKQFGNVILQATSNAFGDFKFDFLEAGNYVVEVADREIEVELNESMTIGDIEL